MRGIILIEKGVFFDNIKQFQQEATGTCVLRNSIRISLPNVEL